MSELVAEVCREHRASDCSVCDEFDDDLWVHPRDLATEEPGMCEQQESDIDVLYAAMCVLSRLGRSDGASMCASAISKIHADAARVGAVEAGAA